MTPTPPSTNSSQGARSPEEQFRVDAQAREGMGTTSCSYATPVTRKKNQSQGDSSPDDMQNRIDRLEGLVLSLMHGGANVDAASAAAAGAATTQSTTDSGSSAKAGKGDDNAMAYDEEENSDEEEGLATSLGFLKVDTDKGKSLYVGQEHWHTLLADISEVKNYFTSHKKELETSYERVKSSKPMAAREGPTLLLGALPASEIEIRAELPPKSAVLTLCSRYFNSMDNAVNIIHGPTFQQQLKDHWQDPNKTPIMWLGMLYSVLCLAMLSYHKVGDEPPEWRGRTLELANEYRLRTVQCLIKSDYTKPNEYTVETMILYVFGEYSSRWDADLGLWLIVSLIVRIAYRMGYHRDAKWFPSITPFQAEMRRRTWALVRMSDVIFSHQVSLPSMIYENDCDTQLPNNIFDDEFNPSVKELPPSRPSTVATPIAYMIAKSRLCFELGNILQATGQVGKHVPYDEIIRFDAKLRQIMQELPPHLKLTTLEGSHDPVTLIIARFNVDILYQKILCLLHRKYLPRARQSARYAHSRRAAIEASLTALDHLAVLYRESQSNGRLRSVSWFVKSIATKDFTLPAMLVILDLHFDNIAAQSSVPQDDEGASTWNDDQRSKMIGSLETAREIWNTLADTSMEAFKAAKVIDIMLDKIKDPASIGPEMPGAPSPMPGLTQGVGTDVSPAMAPGFVSPNSLPDFNATANPFSTPNPAAFMGMDFGMPGSEGLDFQTDGFAGAGPASPFSSMFSNLGANTNAGMDMGANFDWNAFENYTQMANWGADQSFQIYGAGGDQSSPGQTSSLGGRSGTVTTGASTTSGRSEADVHMADDLGYEPSEASSHDPAAALLDAISQPSKKRRQSIDCKAVQQTKKVKLDKAHLPGLAAQSLAKDRAKQLPEQIWQHIFTLVPPRDLGRLLTVNKLFHAFLSPFSTHSPELDLLLSSSFPSVLLPALPLVLVDADMHVIHPRAIQAGTVQPHIQVTKLFWSEHVEQIKLEFQKVKALGSAAAEEWIKGLEIRGKQALADASRWEKWASTGGMAQFQALKTAAKAEAPFSSTPLALSAPLGKTSPDPAQSIGEHHRQAPVADDGRGSRVPLEANPHPLRTPVQQKRTKEEAAHLKAQRRTDIENRALLLDPPLTANVLAHIPSFQAALQLITPLDDHAWELLKPRLLAQRVEAELREKQSYSNPQTLEDKLPTMEADKKPSREPREVTDQEWDDIQGPVRARISEYADEIIEGWNNGAKVKRKNCPQYAADVLLYVRKRFYAEVAKDTAATIAAGKKPVVEPPEGPWTQRLTLENMKWVFDVKIKPRTEPMRKELFLCNSCLGVNGVLKFFGFEGVLQHYAAKHTVALSLGNVVVHWRAEWPEVPPFSPDPLAKEKAYHGNEPRNALASNAPIQPNHSVFQPGTPAVYHLPAYGAEAPPFSFYSPRPPIPPISAYGQNSAPTYGPSYSTATYYDPATYSSYPGLFSSEMTHSSQRQLSSYTRPPVPVPNPSEGGSYPNYYDGNSIASVNSTHQHQHENFVRSTQSVWSRVGHHKKIPPAVRAYVAIYHANKLFEESESETLPLSLFIEATSKNKKLRSLRALNGVSCKVCNDDNIFHVPQLARHFESEHVEKPRSQGRAHMDWRTEMIKMPENERMAGLEMKARGDSVLYTLVKEALPWAFEQAFIDKYASKPMQTNPNNTLPPQVSVQTPAQIFTAVPNNRSREEHQQSDIGHVGEQTQQLGHADLGSQSLASSRLDLCFSSHIESEPDIPHLRPASEVYGRKIIGARTQGKPASQVADSASSFDNYSPPYLEKFHDPHSRRKRVDVGVETEQEVATYQVSYPTEPQNKAHWREEKSSDYRDVREQRYSGPKPASSRNRSASVGDRPQDQHPLVATSAAAAPGYAEVETRGREEPHVAHNHHMVEEEEVIYVDESGREIGRGLRARNTLPQESRYGPVIAERFGEYARPSSSWFNNHSQFYSREPSPWSQYAPQERHFDSPAGSDHFYYNRHSTRPPLELSDAYEVVETHHPDGDYFIRRPVRQAGRPYHAYETRQPRPEQSMYPQRGIAQGPSGYNSSHEADPHVPSRPTLMTNYNDIPRHPSCAARVTPADHGNQR
ncbi:hypothetical protein FPRO06_01375 [Fusarium proliferatum]|nr:hypothetical protein FPRO06_01375 [Fusarium proliferatum]